MIFQNQIIIQKIEQGTALAAELVTFIKNSSWEETKEHNAAMIRNWDFSGNEAVFTALADGKIIGMAALLQTDYYPLPEIFPWVSCVFVTEAFRGNRLSEQLIAQANAYAKSLGYHETYISSPIYGLYERYGYRYVKDIVNYGGGTDHLFVKSLSSV